MPIIFSLDRVKEVSTSVGSSDFTLGGSVSGGFTTFNDAFGVGQRCLYTIQHTTLDEWEIGVGQLTDTETLTRDTVLSSSNAGGFVNFSSGSKNVHGDAPAVFLVPLGSAGDLIYLGADGVPASLPIGSEHQILNVSSGIPAYTSGIIASAHSAFGGAASIDTHQVVNVSEVFSSLLPFGNNSSVACTATLNAPANLSGSLAGFNFEVQTDPAFSFNLNGALVGCIGSVDHLGSGSVNQAYGVLAEAALDNAGTITNIFGAECDALVFGGNATTATGVLGTAQNSGGTVTTGYGGQFHSTGCTANYAIKTTSGTVWLHGGVASERVLIVQGTTSQTANLQENRDSSGTFLSGVNAAGEYILTTGSGAPSDSPVDGATYIDTAGTTLYIRASGAWVAVSGGGGGGGSVTSVGNSDGTLTVSPTTGAVVASLNLGHANTWTVGPQTIQTGGASNGALVLTAAASQSASLLTFNGGSSQTADYMTIINGSSQTVLRFDSTPNFRLSTQANFFFSQNGRGITFVNDPINDAFDGSHALVGKSDGSIEIDSTEISVIHNDNGNSTPPILIRPFYVGSSTSDALEAIHIKGTPYGTPSAGFGSRIAFNSQSATTGDRGQAAVDGVWADATDATRSGRFVASVYYTTTLYEGFRIDASSGGAKISFFGASAVAQQNTTGTTTGFTAGAGGAVDSAATFTGNTGSTAYTIGDVVRALKNYGLLAS